jgi:carbon monoxide dehydrogenase subunit G
MDMTGSYQIHAPRELVWQDLINPEILKASISGCQSVEKTSDTEFTAVVTAKIGPVKATFKGKITLSELDRPKSFKISGEGTGGIAGFAKGGAIVTLDEADGGTFLRYEVTATVGGKIAQLGQRLIDSTAKKMAEEFFTAFSAKAGGAEDKALQI